MTHRLSPALCLALASALLAGCSSLNQEGMRAPLTDVKTAAVAEPVDIQLHAVVAGKEGLPRRTELLAGDEVKFHGSMDVNENRAYLAPMIAHIKATAPRGKDDPRRQILIFVHGGMNEKVGAVQRSARLTREIFQKDKEFYPVFIDWNSAPVSCWTEHLLYVRQGERRPIFGPLTSPIYLASDIARGVSRAPVVWSTLAHSSLQQPSRSFMKSAERKRLVAAQEVLKDNTRSTGTGPTVTNATLDQADVRDSAQRLSGAGHPFFFAPKAITATLIDIIGTGAWDMMQRRADQLFQSPTRRADLEAHDRAAIDRIAAIVDAGEQDTIKGRDELHRLAGELKRAPEPPAKYRGADYLNQARPGAVEQFLTELENGLGPHPEQRYSITLVGHSMGTIVSNRILINHPKLPIDRIVYMAAACSIKDCSAAVGPYLRENPRANFYNLSLHPYAEVAEANPSLESASPGVADYALASAGYLIPRGSLLVWLDSFFTKPVTLEDRRLGKWDAAIMNAGIFPGEVRNRVHFKMFAIGDRDQPSKHGAFASENFSRRFWKRDFQAPNPPGPVIPTASAEPKKETRP